MVPFACGLVVFIPVSDRPGKLTERVTETLKSSAFLARRLGLNRLENFWNTDMHGSYFAPNVKPSRFPDALMLAMRPSEVDREL